MQDTEIQWHPGFVAAMGMEFAEYREALEFDREHNLNTLPLKIDLLIIKKNQSVEISNEIGRLFRGHNVMEYKSPDDSMNIDIFYKSGAYASLYKAYGRTADEIKADDITVSIVREAKPEGLFRYFNEKGVAIEKPFRGIYYVKDMVLFPTQVIVARELENDTHIWLKALSGHMGVQDMKRLIEESNNLENEYDRELADSILEVSLSANQDIIDKLREDNSMGEMMMKIVEPLVIEKERKAKEEGILGAVKILRKFGHSDEEIKTEIITTYHLSEDAAEQYL